jgi:hypothetical protein
VKAKGANLIARDLRLPIGKGEGFPKTPSVMRNPQRFERDSIQTTPADAGAGSIEKVTREILQGRAVYALRDS